MEFVYYLVKNRKIVEKFSEINNRAIKTAFEACCNDSEEIDEVEVYKVPFDACVSDFSQLFKYGINVTCDYFDDDSDIVIL